VSAGFNPTFHEKSWNWFARNKRQIKGVYVTIEIIGGPEPRLERYHWEASLVRFLLETPGSAEDWGSMPLEDRMKLVEAEVEDDTPERRALVAHAMAILGGEA